RGADRAGLSGHRTAGAAQRRQRVAHGVSDQEHVIAVAVELAEADQTAVGEAAMQLEEPGQRAAARDGKRARRDVERGALTVAIAGEVGAGQIASEGTLDTPRSQTHHRSLHELRLLPHHPWICLRGIRPAPSVRGAKLSSQGAVWESPENAAKRYHMA